MDERGNISTIKAHFKPTFLGKANSGGSFQAHLAVHVDPKVKVSRTCLEYFGLSNSSAVPAVSQCISPSVPVQPCSHPLPPPPSALGSGQGHPAAGGSPRRSLLSRSVAPLCRTTSLLGALPPNSAFPLGLRPGEAAETPANEQGRQGTANRLPSTVGNG